MDAPPKARKLTERQARNAARIETLNAAADFLQWLSVSHDPLVNESRAELSAALRRLANRVPHRLPRFMTGARESAATNNRGAN